MTTDRPARMKSHANHFAAGLRLIRTTAVAAEAEGMRVKIRLDLAKRYFETGEWDERIVTLIWRPDDE